MTAYLVSPTGAAVVLTPKRREITLRRMRIAKLVKQGKTLPEITEVLQLKDAIVRSDLKVMGIDISVVSSKSHLRKLTPEVERLHAQGLSGQSIAMKLGVTSNQVYHILTKLSLKENPIVERQLSDTDLEHVHGMIGLILMGDVDVVWEVNKEFGMSMIQARRLYRAARKMIVDDCAGDGKLVGRYILELSRTGRTIEQVAEAAGVKVKDIRRIASDLEVSKLWLVSQKLYPRVSKTAELYLTGNSKPDIANRLGVSVHVVIKDLERVGLPTSEWFSRRSAQVKHLLEAGSNGIEIAGQMNISAGAVNHIIMVHEEFGLYARRRRDSSVTVEYRQAHDDTKTAS